MRGGDKQCHGSAEVVGLSAGAGRSPVAGVDVQASPGASR